jgi:hypothetical protein
VIHLCQKKKKKTFSILSKTTNAPPIKELPYFHKLNLPQRPNQCRIIRNRPRSPRLQTNGHIWSTTHDYCNDPQEKRNQMESKRRWSGLTSPCRSSKANILVVTRIQVDCEVKRQVQVGVAMAVAPEHGRRKDEQCAAIWNLHLTNCKLGFQLPLATSWISQGSVETQANLHQ